MKKTAFILIMCLVVAFALVGCDKKQPSDMNGPEPQVAAADVVVNKVKTLNAAITSVYQDDEGNFIATHRSGFRVVDDDFTVNELEKIFIEKSWGVDSIDIDGNGSIDQMKLEYGFWPDITVVTLPNNDTKQWVIRDSDYKLVTERNSDVKDNGEYYLSYENIENPAPFTKDDLSELAPSDNKPHFYVNNVSTKTVKLLISASKPDGSVDVLFDGTVQITDDDLLFEEVIKAACDEKGILYGITSGIVGSLGPYANALPDNLWWHGFVIDGKDVGNYQYVDVITVGDGDEIYLKYTTAADREKQFEK